MLTERDLAEMIFDAFRQTRCEVGHVVMMRTFRFGVALKLNPVERDKYFSALSAIINLQYAKYEEHPECLRLTEKGYDYIYDEDKVNAMQEVPWLFPTLDNTNWEKTFNKFYQTMIEDKKSKYHIDWDLFFQWINAYNPNSPVPENEQNAIMRTEDGQKQKVFDIICKLPDDNTRLSFYLCAQDYCEQTVLNNGKL